MESGARLQRWEKHTEWPLAAVAGIFLLVYSIDVLAQPRGQVKDALDIGTTIVWGLFVIDYLVRFSLAPDRTRWFFRHLLDLAMVALPFLRQLRLLRLLVLFEVLHKAIGGAIRGRVVVYTAFSAVLLIYVASLAILDTERLEPDSKITTFGDALWWSLTTVTTVGYGDLAPVTGVGRVIAALLMLGGISLVGVVTATLASWIVQRVAEEDDVNQAATAFHIEDLRTEMQRRIDSLTEEVRQLSEAHTSAASPPWPKKEGPTVAGPSSLVQ